MRNAGLEEAQAGELNNMLKNVFGFENVPGLKKTTKIL